MIPRPIKAIFSKSNVIAFLVFFSVLATWAGATPMFGTPDEPAHLRRAASLVRGQGAGEDVGGPRRMIQVPAILAGGVCYAFQPEQSADCLDLPADDSMATIGASATSYPPLMHFVVGVPSLFIRGLKGLYAMRLANVTMCAALLALAVRNMAKLARPGPIALGLATSLTPMALFLGGPVSSSGVPIAGGFAIWTSALVLLEEKPPRSLAVSAAAFAIPFYALLLTRRDALMWGAFIMVILLVITPWRRIRDVLQDRLATAWILSVGVVAVLQWLLWGSREVSTVQGLEDSVGHTGLAFSLTFRYLLEAMGILGWLETVMVPAFYYGWFSLWVVLMVGALAVGKLRYSAAILLGIFLMVGSATWIGSIRFPGFQGRYYMPFAVGIPIIAAKAIADAGYWRVPQRAVVVALGYVFLLQQLAFAQHMRRYAVGAHGTWYFITDHRWEPTLGPIWFFLLVYALTTAAMYIVIGRIALGYGAQAVDSPSDTSSGSPSDTNSDSDLDQETDQGSQDDAGLLPA